jgi:hypothetical protein
MMKSIAGHFADSLIRAVLRRVRDEDAPDPRTSPATKLAMATPHDERHARAVPEMNLTSGLRHPRQFARLHRFAAIRDLEYETPE